MKVVAFILLFFYPFMYHSSLKDILLRHQWKVASMKTIEGTKDPNSTASNLKIDSTSAFCNQIISFQKDHTCKLENKGKGLWSQVDQFNWSIDPKGSLIFRNKEKTFSNGFSLIPLSFNNDSVLLYIPYLSIESIHSRVVIYKLIKISP